MALLSVLALALALTLCACSTKPNDREDDETLYLTYRECRVMTGMPIRELLSALGEDYTVVEAASCAGIGKDYVYTYPSMRLYVFAPEEGVAKVTSACYTDDGASYLGVTIGSSADAVIAALGQPAENTDSRMTYKSATATLTFTLRDGAVSAVVLAEK